MTKRAQVSKCITTRVVVDCHDLRRHVGEVAGAMLDAIRVETGWAIDSGLILTLSTDPPPTESALARYEGQIQQWQPIETIPEKGPFLVYWRKSLLGGPQIDMVGGKFEYDEIIGFGEPPALCWHALPDPPAALLASEEPT